MAKVIRPILFDADAMINLLSWGYYAKVKEKLGVNFCVSEYVAKKEVLFYTEPKRGRKKEYPGYKLTKETVPRLVMSADLSPVEEKTFFEYFVRLNTADAGERETFALAWVLGYDVCSNDTDAEDIWRRLKPSDCPSRHYFLQNFLREQKIIR